MSFFEAVAACFSKYANFSGRASRAEYWWFLLFVVISSVLLNAMVTAFFGSAAGLWVMSIYYLLVLLPSLAVGARRLHDMGFSGWWQIFHLTGLGSLALIIWFVLPGTPAANRYGEPVVIDYS